MVWMDIAYLGLAFMRNKRADNAGFGALVLGGFCCRFWDATFRG